MLDVLACIVVGVFVLLLIALPWWEMLSRRNPSVVAGLSFVAQLAVVVLGAAFGLSWCFCRVFMLIKGGM